MNKVTQQQDGFTLIELLVVIAIIGILAVAAIPQVMDAICDARISTTQSELGTVQTAVQQAIVSGNHNTISDLDTCGFGDCTELSDFLPGDASGTAGEDGLASSVNISSGVDVGGSSGNAIQISSALHGVDGCSIEIGGQEQTVGDDGAHLGLHLGTGSYFLDSDLS